MMTTTEFQTEFNKLFRQEYPYYQKARSAAQLPGLSATVAARCSVSFSPSAASRLTSDSCASGAGEQG